MRRNPRAGGTAFRPGIVGPSFGGAAVRVLVTGNLGYVGTVLTPMLAARGYRVDGLDAGFFRHGIMGQLSSSGVDRQLVKDIRDVDQGELAGLDAIVHLAALSNDPAGELNPTVTHSINTLASERLAIAAKAAGVERFVFASSCSLYGAAGADAVTEDAPMTPQTAYARSKVETEAILNDLAEAGFSPTFLRFGTAYGFSPRMRMDIAVNNLTGWAVATRQVKLLSDGSAWRPFVHVRDMCSAVIAVLEAETSSVHNQAFNVGRAGENYEIRDVARLVSDVVPGSSVTFGSGATADKRSYRVSFEKIARVLPSFAPSWTVRDGVEEMVPRFAESGLTVDALHGPEFVRLAQLKRLMEEAALNSELFWTGGGR